MNLAFNTLPIVSLPIFSIANKLAAKQFLTRVRNITPVNYSERRPSVAIDFGSTFMCSIVHEVQDMQCTINELQIKRERKEKAIRIGIKLFEIHVHDLTIDETEIMQDIIDLRENLGENSEDSDQSSTYAPVRAKRQTRSDRGSVANDPTDMRNLQENALTQVQSITSSDQLQELPTLVPTTQNIEQERDPSSIEASDNLSGNLYRFVDDVSVCSFKLNLPRAIFRMLIIWWLWLLFRKFDAHTLTRILQLKAALSHSCRK